MSLEITAEQEALRETSRRFLSEATPLSRVREVMATDTVFDTELWTRMATELGALGLAVPEELGGAGLGYPEVSYLAEEAGRALAPGALLATAGLAVPALMAGNERARARLLPRIVDGAAVGAVAWLDPGADWSSTSPPTRAARDGHGWTLTGDTSPVLDGAVADVLLVLAEHPQGPTVFSVEPDQAGVTRTPLPGLDQTRGLARVELDGAAAEPVSAPGAGRAMVTTALDHANVVLASEMVGGAQACLDMSVEYAKEREQFGRPIGAFQAVKHKCAEVLVEVEGARSMTRYAAWCASHNTAELPTASAIAKATAAEAYFRAAAENVQIHGGIGFTWEHDAHLYFKRAKTSQMLFGDTGAYRRHVADLIGI
ncbi:acyl-CoA dehydrogenase family protein [Halostreptopolyspora alba]|uniref:acyl-CoA dehydrogenase family protein n=1 Tax=Halostreptopolyspora alba TaxID=2487137 RepID=UPI0026B0FD7B